MLPSLYLLVPIVLFAFAAQSALASGTTAFTCAPTEGKSGAVGFSDEHCTKAAEGELVRFQHVEIPTNTPTNVVGTNVQRPKNKKSYQCGAINEKFPWLCRNKNYLRGMEIFRCLGKS